MEKTGAGRNQAFAERIQSRYAKPQTVYDWTRLVYRQKKRADTQIHVQNDFRRMIFNALEQKISQYEKKYYQVVTNQDSRRLLHTIETIYSQPGEKKQLIYLFKKLGMVTKEQKEWQENARRLVRYEDELSLLRRKVIKQEELVAELKKTRAEPQSTADLTREVMRSIKKEIRLERLLSGMDEWR